MGCSTESKFYISIYYYCENKKIVFLHLNFLQVSPSRKVHFHVKVIHQKFGGILLIFRGCSTELKFYISIYYYCENKKKTFLLNYFHVSPSRMVHFHVKVIHKKFGCILLIFMIRLTQLNLYFSLYYFCQYIKKKFFCT